MWLGEERKHMPWRGALLGGKGKELTVGRVSRCMPDSFVGALEISECRVLTQTIKRT